MKSHSKTLKEIENTCQVFGRCGDQFGNFGTSEMASKYRVVKEGNKGEEETKEVGKKQKGLI